MNLFYYLLTNCKIKIQGMHCDEFPIKTRSKTRRLTRDGVPRKKNERDDLQQADPISSSR